MQVELSKMREDVRDVLVAKRVAEEAGDRTRNELKTLQTSHHRMRDEFAKLKRQLDEVCCML